MSTPETGLNAAERAALADLESAAVAADPDLASRLTGRPPRKRPDVRALWPVAMAGWKWLLERRWIAVVLTLGGFVLMYLGLAATVAVSGLGALLTTVGLLMTAETLRLRTSGHRS